MKHVFRSQGDDELIVLCPGCLTANAGRASHFDLDRTELIRCHSCGKAFGLNTPRDGEWSVDPDYNPTPAK